MFNKKDNPLYKEFFNAATVGMALVSGMIVGGVIGFLLDKWLGTSPWLLFFFLVIGFIAGIKNALYYLKKAGITLESIKNNDDNDENQKK